PLPTLLSSIPPFFCISQLITWTTHDLPATQSARFIDLFLAHNPLMPLYVAASIVASRKEELLKLAEETDGDPAMLHNALAKIPRDLNIEGVVRGAVRLFEEVPPAEVQRLAGGEKALSSASCVNTWDDDEMGEKIWLEDVEERIKILETDADAETNGKVDAGGKGESRIKVMKGNRVGWVRAARQAVLVGAVAAATTAVVVYISATDPQWSWLLASV
ncbi:hypothetical protein HK097_011016, partial [Rhizophlyctis rosea]